MKTRYKICGCVIAVILLIIGRAGGYLHFHWNVSVTTESFTESSAELKNPNRGFYYIYGFRIKDESVDYSSLVKQKFANDTDTTLALIEVNLQEYRNGKISDAGLQNIKKLFDALRQEDKTYLVRFLYDWDGENQLYEPDSIDIILNHMKQVKSVLWENADIIYTLQGLFVGNWGEMNGTKYVDQVSLRKLAETYLAVSDKTTYLSVRMPAQWRIITQTGSVKKRKNSSSKYYGRLGLFNDGMLGNEGDYGTYGSKSASEAGIYSAWCRRDELQFQNTLCKNVPNGGEVIVDNEYNDFDNALADLKTMHVTYLNRDYDAKVLNKWANTTVSTGDCYDGMDGLSYMERHMGYRLLIKNVKMQQDFWEDTLEVSVTMQNVGFAPLYKPCEAKLTFYGEDGQKYDVKLKQTLSKLSGGNDASKKQTLTAAIPLDKIEGGRSTAYFTLTDSASNLPILLANEQTYEENGYEIGQVVVEK